MSDGATTVIQEHRVWLLCAAKEAQQAVLCFPHAPGVGVAAAAFAVRRGASGSRVQQQKSANDAQQQGGGEGGELHCLCVCVCVCACVCGWGNGPVEMVGRRRLYSRLVGVKPALGPRHQGGGVGTRHPRD